jgi:hypothetical protein
MVAATYGRGLYTTVIPGSPEIRFTAPAVTYTETTAATTGCRNYKDYSIPVAITKAPTGDAIATFDVLAGNSAIPGSDFEYTTNGDFNNPSHQHIFSNGSSALETITIRIYDDNEIEAPESFTIAYSLSGSSNAVTGSSNSFKVTINSNDLGPLTAAGFSGIIGVGDNTNTNAQPFRAQYSDSRTQCLYTRAELMAMGMKGGDTITSLSFFVVSKGSSGPFNNFTVKVKNSSSQSLSLGDYFESGMTIVYGPVNYSTVVGTNKFNLNGPFIWNGDSSLLLDVCFHNPSAMAANDIVSSTVTAVTLSVWDRNNGVVGCDLPFPNFNLFGTSALRPDLGIEVSRVGNPVASQLNSSQSNYFGSNNDLYYFSPTGEILGRIRNLDPFNYGCTEVKIDRAGTGTTLFWNNNPANSLMNKSIRVIPSINHNPGQYEITLYYSLAEKQAWEAATGQSWNNIQLVKTQSAISDVTPSNPNGAGTVQIVDPIRGTFGNDFTLTYTFNSGFSGFGAGIPGQVPLPVTLLNFSGHTENKVNVLNWATAFEQNTRNFEIEKSSDGANYEKIGSVRAAGNSADKRQYLFTDIHPFAINYYRLRMNDNDGRYKLSQVVLIRVQNASQDLWVLNNPFSEYIDIRFAKEAKHVKLQLFNAAGYIVQETMQTGARDHYKWMIAESMPRGSYFLLAIVDGTSFRFKVIKQ